MASIKVRNLKKGKKAAEKKKKGGKPLGEPVDVKGVAGGGGDCGFSGMGDDPKTSMK